MPTFTLDEQQIRRLQKTLGEDATQDVLLDYLDHGGVLVEMLSENTHRPQLMMNDPGANSASHALARLIITIRRRHRRRADRLASDTQRLEIHLAEQGLITTDNSEAEDAELHQALHDALHHLDKAAADCLVAYYLDGATTEEIAAGIGINLAAARKRLQRARDYLAASEVLRTAFYESHRTDR